jgi:hypothetical protein
VTDRCRRHRSPRPPTAVVELVDESVVAPPTRDVDLERAIEGLSRGQRRAVYLHYFVGLDVVTVGEVLGYAPGTVATTLHQARARLLDLLGDDRGELMDDRLSAAARRWQDQQPLAPDVPLERLDAPLARHLPWRAVVVAAAAVVLVGGGAAAVVRALGPDDATPRASDTSPTAQVESAPHRVVPWRDLEPGHPVLGHDQNGVLVTPYDDVTVTGSISGTVHPGDTLVFEAAMTSPGILPFHPCPDYTIAFGTHATTRQLNCAQVPYFASIVRPDGGITAFRPVIPAGTVVFFRMQVTVPDELGSQRVVWTLDGPSPTPGFDGIVEVTASGSE